MTGKTAFGLGLIILGAITGALAGTAMAFGNQGPIIWFFGSVAMVCVMVGSIIATSTVLDATAQPAADSISAGLDDDVENLRQGIITWPVVFSILTFVATLVYALYFLRFHKFEASWGIFPVWLVTLVAMGFLAFLVVRTDWFQDQQFETPILVHWIAIGGFILALLLGISRTEDVRLINLQYPAEQANYNYHTYRIYFPNSGEVDSPSSSVDFDMPECSGKSCEGYGYAILFIIFIVLVLILVIGSAFVQHFWVFAGGVFIAMMILLAIQALMFSPWHYRRSRRYS